ncbi:MAG: NUDIX hydrolase [Lachnospiraceae bacterium]|nr:NUDIX hydrolase [Lachnospiraceae bacterium]
MDYQLKRLKRTRITGGHALDFCADTMQLPGGRLETWDFIHHLHGGGAAVVPVLPDGRILLVRELRPAVDQEMLELPAGARDYPEEPGEEVAARELREETGYRAGKMSFLAKIYSAPAFCDETTEIYLATDLQKEGDMQLDEAEEIQTEVYELAELMQMIQNGEITDGKTVAGIFAYAAKVK